MGMTVGEHAALLQEALESLPHIGMALRVANIFAIVQELYCEGEMNEAEYKNMLHRLLEQSGGRISNRKEEA